MLPSIKRLGAMTLLAACALGGNLCAQDAHKTEITSPETRMQWFRDAKFGLFIHWGVYSRAGGEWKGTTNHAEWLQLTAKIPIAEYTEFGKDFNPTKFDADEWAQAAKDAGMKYVVITSKHHDGFAMFDSPSDPYNIVKLTKFGRDPLKELAAACEKRGVKFCVYYSLGRDWHDPDCNTSMKGRANEVDFPDHSKQDFSRYFERKVKPQVKELLAEFPHLGIFWFDTPELINREQSQELRKIILDAQPNCIINNRIGNGLGDYGTPEQQIPAGASAKPWESCMTMNGHWGYNSHDANWKSTETLLRNLIDVTSKGGNYLLNVGPTGEGAFPNESIARLNEIGAWLKTNGDAIYGAGRSPFGPEFGAADPEKKDKNGKPVFNSAWQWRCTTKPGKLYFHLFQWPGKSFAVPVFPGKASRAYMLTDSKTSLDVSQQDQKIVVQLPEKPTDSIASVLVIEVAPPAEPKAP